MASVIEFDVSGDGAAAKTVVQAAAVAQGFAVEPTEEWSFFLLRGNSTTSLFLGALAGKDFYLKFGHDFSVADGHLVARLSRDIASSAQAGIFLANRTVS